MIWTALACLALLILAGGSLWRAIRAAGQYDNDVEHDAMVVRDEIDEAQLEGDLQHELRDISFGRRS